MAEEIEDDVIDPVDTPEPDAQTSVESEVEPQEEIVVSLGEPAEETEDRGHGLVPRLRGLVKEKSKLLVAREKELAELRAKITAPSQTILGAEPTFESSGYDADKFKSDLLAWNERKRELDAKANDAKARQDAQDAEWAKTRQGYETAKAALNVPDFELAEESVRELFTETQQALILGAAEKPEVMVYALGNDPVKAKILAAITDPVKFTAAVARMETKELKVETRRKPEPEGSVRTSGVSSTSSQSAYERKLAELEKKADETGNRTPVIQFKRDWKARQAQR